VARVRRDVVPLGTLAAGIAARRGAGLLREIGVAGVPGVLAVLGVRVAGVRVQMGRVQVRAAAGAGIVRPAGKGVGGRIRPGAARIVAPLESGRIGRGKARAAG
jgi:hypothetical protein